MQFSDANANANANANPNPNPNPNPGGKTVMEDPLTIAIGLSGWGAVCLGWWIHRGKGVRAKYAHSLEEWRKHVEQTLILCEAEEQLSIELAGEQGVAPRTLKHKIRHDVAQKMDLKPEFDRIQPWRLRAALRKIDDRAQDLKFSFPFGKRRRHRASRD